VADWASKLRLNLSQRARDFAGAEGLTCYDSLGSVPTVLFPADNSTSRHGNFIDASYRAIVADQRWAGRLKKNHTQRHALPEDRRGDAKELSIRAIARTRFS
jgi:hypothetical protein